MARSTNTNKTTSANAEVKNNEMLETKAEETKAEEVSSASSDNNSMEQFAAMFAQMQAIIEEQKKTIEELKSQKEAEAVDATLNKSMERAFTPDGLAADRTADILERLVNKKSEREVVLVHNREMGQGLSTSLKLNGLDIHFHTMGEQRLLTWQQAEECVSKYYSWFKKGIIILGHGCMDLAERYNVPCLDDGRISISKADLAMLGSKTERELEDFVMKLTEDDKDFVYSYWLGKCYAKDSAFLNRSKIELLNRLSGRGVFNNLLTSMNFSSINS